MRATLDPVTRMARARRRALPVRPDLIDVLAQAHRCGCPPHYLAMDLYRMGVGTPAVSHALEALTYYRFLIDTRRDFDWRRDLLAALAWEWAR